MRATGWVIGALLLPVLVLVPGEAPVRAGVACTQRGTTGDDVLSGTPGPDVLCGLGGNDTLLGRGGDDVLYGAAGDDLLIGRDGDDELVGADGRDRLVPGRGHDLMDGGADVDTVKYRDVADWVVVHLKEGIAAGKSAGADRFTSIEGVVGSAGDDFLNGTADRDLIRGFGGDDVLFAGGGPDHLDGGEGTDRVDYSDLIDAVSVDLGSHRLLAGRAGRIVGVEDIVGSQWGDHLSGDGGPNVISGGGGSDEISGGAGDDELHGESGRDHVAGGDGADELWPGGSWDTVDGGADPGDALAGDVVRYDDIERWARRLQCSASGCTFVDWELTGGGLTIDLDLGTVDIDVNYVDYGQHFNLSELDSVAGVEAAYATPLADVLRGGQGATAVALCGMRGKDTIDTQDGYGGDLFDARGTDVRTQDPGDSITTC